MRILLIAILIFLTGCVVRNYKNFELSRVPKNYGIAIGKVNVEHDSGNFDASECDFCVGTVCHRLLEEGYVFMSLEQGIVDRVRLYCSYPAIGYRDHLFAVNKLEVKPGVVYFGNLVFSVNIESSYTYAVPAPAKTDSSMDYYDSQTSYDTSSWKGFGNSLASELMTDTFYGIVDLFISDDVPETYTKYNLSATVSVEDNMADVVEVFRKQVERENIQVEKNLIDIKWVK